VRRVMARNAWSRNVDLADLSQSCSIDQVLLVSLASSHSERSSMGRSRGNGRLISGVFSAWVIWVMAG